MSASLSPTEHIEYTDWERGKWHDWLRHQRDGVLATNAGPHGDGRFQTIGDVVRHIFALPLPDFSFHMYDRSTSRCASQWRGRFGSMVLERPLGVLLLDPIQD